MRDGLHGFDAFCLPQPIAVTSPMPLLSFGSRVIPDGILRPAQIHALEEIIEDVITVGEDDVTRRNANWDHGFCLVQMLLLFIKVVVASARRHHSVVQVGEFPQQRAPRGVVINSVAVRIEGTSGQIPHTNTKHHDASDTTVLLAYMLHGVIRVETEVHVVVHVMPLIQFSRILVPRALCSDVAAIQLNPAHKSVLPNGCKVSRVGEVVDGIDVMLLQDAEILCHLK